MRSLSADPRVRGRGGREGCRAAGGKARGRGKGGGGGGCGWWEFRGRERVGEGGRECRKNEGALGKEGSPKKVEWAVM